jgi:hypothetical protein
MLMVFFTGIDSFGESYSCGVGGYSLEDSLEEAAQLVRAGGTLQRVEVLIEGSPPLLLPVEAFDGSSIVEAVADLRQQWQQILSSST